MNKPDIKSKKQFLKQKTIASTHRRKNSQPDMRKAEERRRNENKSPFQAKN